MAVNARLASAFTGREPPAYRLPRPFRPMFSSTAYMIRRASDEDASALEYIAALDSQGPISTNALIGEIDGRPAAAISLVSGRVVADPFRPTAELVAHLRARAYGVVAADRRPSLRDRIRAGIRTTPRTHTRPARSAAWPVRTPIHQGGG
jgi:hypothetical protein